MCPYLLIPVWVSPASLQLGHAIEEACSTPDGSCLLTMVGNLQNQATDIHAHHWTSFGSSAKGFTPTQIAPGMASHQVTSFGSRNRVHVLSIFAAEATSIFCTALHITRKSTEFAFRSKATISTVVDTSTANNCLIDCHLDVWTRFPVLPAVARATLAASIRKPQSITFISNENLGRVNAYFAKMISTFERTTRKPTDGKLSAIVIEWAPDASTAAINAIERSCFHLGSFVVELLCLIPIQ